MLTNWAGNVVFSTERLAAPRSIGELRDVVVGAERAHVLGTGHSFSRIADTTGTLISLRDMPSVFEVGSGSVRVDAGVRLGDLADRLQERGLALHNLPSLPHISLAGACATATHGSGDRNGSLAAAVRSVELITADGSPVTFTRGDADFGGAVVALGALGVEQRVYLDLPWSVLVDRFDEVFACAYSVSVFTDWRGDIRAWVKRRTDQPQADLTWTGAREATTPQHPVLGLSGETCTRQLGVPGPWHERLPHFRSDFTPSVGDELQSEYLISHAHAGDALRALAEVGPRIAPVVQTAEIRTVDADACWLSPAFERPSVAFHFTWTPAPEPVSVAVALVEEALAPWSPRPHMGKVFARQAQYDPRFTELRARLDPTGKFANPAVDA
jgi:xylitol oxidase